MTSQLPVRSRLHSEPPLQPVLPGIPDDVAADILSRLHWHEHATLKLVSRSLYDALTSHTLRDVRRQLGRQEKYLFVLPEEPAGGQFCMYDASANRWFKLPSMPGRSTARSLTGFGCVGVAGKLFVLGGSAQVDHGDDAAAAEERVDVEEGVTADVHVFDPVAWQWTRGDSMATPRCWFACGAIDEHRIIVSGGQGRTSFLKSAEIFDTRDNSWHAVSSMVQERTGHHGAVIDGNFWAISGEVVRHDTQFIPPHLQKASIEIYNPEADLWELHPNLWIDDSKVPCPTAVVNDKLYTIHHGRVMQLHAPTGKWHKIGIVPGASHTSRSYKRYGFACAELYGNLLLIGGAHEQWLQRQRYTRQFLDCVDACVPLELWQEGAKHEGSAAAPGFQRATEGILMWQSLANVKHGRGPILGFAILSI